MEFPTIDKFTKDVAEKALDEFIYEGKTIREWVEILVKQQHCEDCVSREAIIDLVKELPNANPSYSHTCDVIDRADLLYLLERLESVKPQQKWVSASERLPEEDGLYLVSVRYDIMGHVTVCSDWGEWNNGKWICDFGYCSESEKVIAWSSLPKPYKEDENGV